MLLTNIEGDLIVAVYALLGLAAAKLATQTVRCVRDCGQSGWIRLGVCVGLVVLLASAMLRWLGDGADLLFWILIVAAFAAGAALFLRPGQNAPNSYGPAPGVSGTTVGRASPGGMVTAVIWVAAGIVFGFTVLSWQAGMDRQREQRMQMAAPDPGAAPPIAAAPHRTGIDAENDALSNRIDDLLKTEKRIDHRQSATTEIHTGITIALHHHRSCDRPEAPSRTPAQPGWLADIARRARRRDQGQARRKPAEPARDLSIAGRRRFCSA